ncbi:MAG: hypothetical protein JEZ06_17105 [Anaerolineaceae bacterium]|nr:hypothetical protein [Anaerolineaceae bacterium]
MKIVFSETRFLSKKTTWLLETVFNGKTSQKTWFLHIYILPYTPETRDSRAKQKSLVSLSKTPLKPGF